MNYEAMVDPPPSRGVVKPALRSDLFPCLFGCTEVLDDGCEDVAFALAASAGCGVRFRGKSVVRSG